MQNPKIYYGVTEDKDVIQFYKEYKKAYEHWNELVNVYATGVISASVFKVVEFSEHHPLLKDRRAKTR